EAISCALCRLSGLHFCGVFAKARPTVAQRSVMERLLRVGHFRRIAFPSLEHWSLQRAPERKTQLPRQARQLIHCVEMFGGLQVGLPAREKDETGDSSRNHASHAAHSSLCDFLYRSLLRTIFS